MNNNEEIISYIPKNFLWSILPQDLTKTERDKIRLAFHQIYLIRAKASDTHRKDPLFQMGYTSMNMEVLRSINDKMKSTIDTMKKYGLIQFQLNERGTESYSSILNRSRRVRITPGLLGINTTHLGRVTSSMYRKESITSKNIIKSIRKHQNKYMKDLNKLFKPVIETTRNLRIDTTKSVQIAQKLFDNNEIDFETYNYTINHIDELNSEYSYYKACEYGRHHHQFSILPSVVRSCVYLEGKRYSDYCMIDVKNMQPFILASLLDPKFRTYFVNEIDSYIFNVLEETTLTPNLLKFKKDCQTGKLWDKMVKALSEKRGEIKSKTLMTMYGKSELLSNPKMASKYSNYLKEVYPDLVHLIIRMKELKHQHISHALQRIESKIIYGLVGTRMLTDKKGLSEFTCIHDSYFFVDETLPDGTKKKEYIVNTINTIFDELGFVKPVLSIEKTNKK